MRMRWLAAGLVTGALGVFAPAPATGATNNAEVALDRVATMRVDGAITIGADGVPTDYRITTPLGDEARAAINRVVDGWRFRVVAADGKPTTATGKMRISLAARQSPQGAQVTVDEVRFLKTVPPEAGAGEAELPAGWLRVDGALAPPEYPPAYLAAGVSANVHVVLRVGADGRVRDATAWRTTLFDVTGKDDQMRRAVDAFERVALRRARTWRFIARLRPGQAPDADFVVGVPVSFGRLRQRNDTTGKWQSEVRTRPVLPDWATARDERRDQPVADSFGMDGDAEDDRIRLVTPSNGAPVM